MELTKSDVPITPLMVKDFLKQNFDFKYTEIKTISMNEVKEYINNAKRKTWDVVKIEATWDREALLNAAREEMNKIPMVIKDPEIYQESYSGVSIQKVGNEKTEQEENYNSISRNSVPGEPVFTRFGTLYFTRQGFSLTPLPDITLATDLPEDIIDVWKSIASKPQVTAPQYLNKWATVWPNFLLSLAKKGVITARGRYLKAIDDQFAKAHADGEARLHIPLTTNGRCFFRFFHGSKDNRTINAYHLPATGDAYLFNAYVPHEFGNFGGEDRIHAVFGLPDHHHAAWKHYQPELKTWDDVMTDYVNHLKSFTNAIQL